MHFCTHKYTHTYADSDIHVYIHVKTRLYTCACACCGHVHAICARDGPHVCVLVSMHLSLDFCTPHVYTHVDIRTCAVHAHVQPNVYTHMSIHCTHICLCHISLRTSWSMSTCTHTHAHTHAQTRAHTDMCSFECLYTRPHTHSHTHTHTPGPRWHHPYAHSCSERDTNTAAHSHVGSHSCTIGSAVAPPNFSTFTPPNTFAHYGGADTRVQSVFIYMCTDMCIDMHIDMTS